MLRNDKIYNLTSARRRGSQSGAAAVEFALVFPVFAALVMGSLDFGYFFFTKQVVTNAAREGARAGTMIDPVKGSAVAMSAAGQAALEYMTNNGVGCPGGGNGCVFVSNPTVVVSGAPSIPAIDVVIQYDFKGLTGFAALALPKSVHSHALMRWQ
jgi:TadE-like protein